MSVNFNAATNFPVGQNPSSVAVDDFNKDGNLDIVTGGSTLLPNTFIRTGGLSTLLGNGSGQFGTAVTSSGQQFGTGTAIAVGDFNNDGNRDVISTSSLFGGTASDLFVSLGDGKGGFRTSTNRIIGNNPQSVAVGDVNGDGRLDAVTANGGGNTVSVLLGDGAGAFSTMNNLTLGGSPKAVALRDFNNDGRLDIGAVTVTTTTGATPTTTAQLAVLLGSGTGTFTPATPIELGETTSGATDLTVADFNGDSRPDVAVAEGGKISILLFDPAQAGLRLVYRVAQTASSITSGDFNGDGRVDLAAATTTNGVPGSTVLLGNGQGGFSRPVPFPIGGTSGSLLTAADFNKDGKFDLTSINAASPQTAVALNSTTETDAIAQGTANDGKTFIDASSELTGSITVDLSKGSFVLNGPTRITRNVDRLDDVIGTVRDDKIKGNNRRNFLNGFIGKDDLTGSNGNDSLLGGANNDTLTGGKGKDEFIFSATPNYSTAPNDDAGLETPFSRPLLGVDRIADFERGTDKIILDAATFTVLDAGKRIRFATVEDLDEARSSRAQITYIQDTGRLYYNQNGRQSGFGSGGVFARLNNEVGLSARDFTVVA